MRRLQKIMKNYKKIIARNLAKIKETDKTLKNIYHVIFSHGEHFAYERLINQKIEAVTYSTLDLEIRRFAAYLKHAYPQAEDKFIAIDLENGPSFLIAFWGILMSGNKPYLVNSFYPLELRLKLIERLEVDLVITDGTDYQDATRIEIDNFDKSYTPITDEFWLNEFAISSSLTGMEAKISVFDGSAVVSQILNTEGIIKVNGWITNSYQNEIKVIMILPLFHIFGIMVSYFWFAFFCTTMVFLKDNAPDTIRGTINRHKVTHIFAPPILFNKLSKGIQRGVARAGEKQKRKFEKGLKIACAVQDIFPTLGVKISKKLFKQVLTESFGTSPQFMISGGAHIDGEVLTLINGIGYPLYNGYGTTETAIVSVELGKKISQRTGGSIGNPFDSVTCTYEEDGALIVAGSSLCKRIIYLDGGEEAIDSINTNDIVKKENGQYIITGRKSDLFIGENGENISPDIIQNELRVKRANRFCVLELKGKLSIVLEYGEKLPEAVITNEMQAIRKTLTGITFGSYIDGIYATYQPIASPNAIKISRKQLRHKVDAGEVILIDYKDLERVREMQDSLEDDATMLLIKQLFKEAIETESEIQSDSHFFFDLGGTSLDYLTLINRVESVFDLSINLEKEQKLHTPACFYEYIGEVVD